ncbi:uncharacterized protein LOC143179189 [Calliopsis andreniformis]|uniref:uncharacterized protein LOC143179189 n=1 Tax=Calliopsis andreniformis TaxID=337506 RepID=UPI003FCCCF0E
MNLVQVPTKVVRSKHIHSISLANNQISNIDENIFKNVPNLDCLNLARNIIPFEELLNFRHDNLKTLILSHQRHNEWHTSSISNNNVDFNAVLGKPHSYFPKLENLYLDGIQFKYFQHSFNVSFPRLINLYLRDIGLQFVKPYLFQKLPYSLKSFHLENNNIETFHLVDMANVEALYLDGNRLKTFDVPTSNLRTLSLVNCNISNSFLNISQTNFPVLTTLDLSHNIISDIPTYFINGQFFPMLQSLFLHDNYLMVFPDLPYFDKLTTLSLSNNEIRSITHTITLTKLRKLSLQNNEISHIGELAFSKLYYLEELNLSQNKLQTLHSEWSLNLKNLVYLNLKSNLFTTISDMRLTPLLNLRKLYINGNRLMEIHESALVFVPKNCTVYIL